MLDARAIAVNGLGYGALLTAVNGLWGIAQNPTAPSGQRGRRGKYRSLPRRRPDEDEALLLSAILK